MRKSIVTIISIVLCLALLVSCTNGNKKDDDTPKNTTPDSAGDLYENDEIVFGIATALTGNYQESGVMMSVGADLAIEDLNAEGGINGKKVSLRIMDNKSDAKESPEVARNFVQDKTILGVMGDLMSGQSMAAAPVYEEGGLVELSPTSSASGFPVMGDYMFSVAGIATDESPTYVQKVLVDAFAVERFAIIYANTDWGVEVAETIRDLAEEAGIEIVAYESYMEGDKDFSAALSKIRQADPDHLLLACQYTEGALIANQVNKMGWDIMMSTQGSLTQPSFCDLVGDANVSGIASAVFTEHNPDGYAFRDRFMNHPDSGGIEPSMRASFSYDAIMLLAEAAKACGDDLNRANLRDELIKIKDFPAVAGGLISFEPEGYAHREYTVVSIQDGVWAPYED